MNSKIGKKFLITTHEWFFAPDGEQYRAVFGTIKGVFSSEETLGIKTNSHSTNWYLLIGDMIVAGCQIFYAIQTDVVSFKTGSSEIDFEGKRFVVPNGMTRIYDADNKTTTKE